MRMLYKVKINIPKQEKQPINSPFKDIDNIFLAKEYKTINKTTNIVFFLSDGKSTVYVPHSWVEYILPIYADNTDEIKECLNGK